MDMNGFYTFSASGKVIFIKVKNQAMLDSLNHITDNGYAVNSFEFTSHSNSEPMSVQTTGDYRSKVASLPEELSFVDFLFECTDITRLLVDLDYLSKVSKSLSVDDKAYFSKKLKEYRAEVETSRSKSPSVQIVDDEDFEGQRIPESVINALQGLGFEKSSIEEWSNNFKADGMSHGDMIKDACKFMSSH